MTLKRMDNVGIVVESLDAVIPFFVELGLRLEGRATIEGEWAGRVTGLGAQRVEISSFRDSSHRLSWPITGKLRGTRSATCASCSPWTPSTRRLRDSAGMARNSSAKSCSIWRPIGSATSAAPKGCSSASPRS
jgi:hypothetical protein